MTQQTVQPFWYKGDLQIARYTGDTLGGYGDPLNGAKLTLKMDGDAKRVQSNMIRDWGQTRRLDHMPKPTEIEFELSESTRALMAASLLGTDSAFAQSSATNQTAAPVLIEGEWVEIKAGVIGVSNVTITGKTEGTDFAVLPKLGLIKALNADTAGAQNVGFNKGAVAGGKIVAGTLHSISFAVKMLVEDNVTGESGLLDIPKVTVLPSKAFEFLGSKDHQSLPFKGEVISLPDQDLFTFKPNLVFS